MRTLLLLALLLAATAAQAQLAKFDTLYLPGTDTFYINYSNPGKDVGFTEKLIHFPCVYDTAFGGLWATGFAYSNKKDSVKSGYTNMYSAKTAKGHDGSDKYAVYWAGYGDAMPITIEPKQWFVPLGFYITNSTYAYNSMRSGDFVAKKFGGTSGNDSDWFKLTVRAWLHGAIKPDSVVFYLADFRNSDNSKDYIVKDWQMVTLSSLGAADSIKFFLSSSDNDPVFGMNTPGYFCMDDLAVAIPITGVGKSPENVIGMAYPNPARSVLNVELKDASVHSLTISDASGKTVLQQPVQGTKLSINTSELVSGVYFLRLEGANGISGLRFTKQ